MKIISKTAAWFGLPALCLGLTLQSRADIKDGLVLHLTFDDTYADSSPSKIDGAPGGTPSFVPGLLGKAVSMTSHAAESRFDHVSLGAPVELDFGTDVNFSVAFWCNYMIQTSDPVFICNKNWAASANQGWGIFMQGGGHFRVNTTDNAGHRQSTTSTPVIRDGTWHHVLVTYLRTGDAIIYVDGADVRHSSLAALTGSIEPGVGTFIGQDTTTVYAADFTDLKMDDLGIWLRVLSPGEVAAIYNAGKSGKNIQQVPAIQNPYVQAVSPGDGATGVSPLANITATLVDGLTQVDPASIQMTVNGASVPVSKGKVGGTTTVTHTPTALRPNGVSTVTLSFANLAATPVTVTKTWSFSSTYATLPATMRVAADESKPGFVWNIFENQAEKTDSNARTEAALAGLLTDSAGTPLDNLADPNTQGAASKVADPANPSNAPLHFEIPAVINLNKDPGTGVGLFPADGVMPGVPATDGSSDGLAVEILTYIQLPAGLTIMGVASDDGFRTSAGTPPGAFGVVRVGEYDGGRGVAESTFMMVAEQAGVYGFRTIFENGGGDANIEWFTYKADGVTRVLVNDVANGGLPAFRATTTTIPPYVKSVFPEPVPRQTATTGTSVQIVLADGTTAVEDSTVALKIDGQPATISKVRSGATVQVGWAVTGIAIPADEHTAELSFKDKTGASSTRAWRFRNLKNLVLPTPVVTEDFESYSPEGVAPAGWNAWNFTACSGGYCTTPGENIDDLNSDTYKGWVIVDGARLQGLKSRIFNVAPGQKLNGADVTVETLTSGMLLYAESDIRDGSQAQFIVSKPFNLSSLQHPILTFGSLYEQNQDSIGAVEYSVDGGHNWLPVVYFIDYADGGGDIRLSSDGTVDALATLTGPNPDTASWVDNGVAKGGKYGDGIAAPITPALGDYIVPRRNDDPVVDKRIELFRLPQAGGKADVRLRFAQLGTASWYFSVDNIAFYEGPAPLVTEPARFNAPVLSGGNMTVSWTGSGTLQEAAAVTGPWTASANQANPQTIPAAAAQKFLRIVQ
jgi:hypothetical protein